MRIKLASIVLGSLLTAPFAYSAEVACQLDTKSLSANESTKTVEPAPLAIVNREWAIPGVEQTSKDLLPPVKIDIASPPRLRFCIESAEDCTDVATCLRYPRVGPEWLDEVAWPLTRELYGLGRPDYPYCDQQVFWFGGVGLQR